MKNIHNNQNGFVLISVMLVLVVLTVIGISATTTTTIELKIAGNDRLAKMDFYNLEVGLREGRVWVDTIGRPSTTPIFEGQILDGNSLVVGSYKVLQIADDGVDTNFDGVSTVWDDTGQYAVASDHPANQLPFIGTIYSGGKFRDISKNRVGSGSGVGTDNGTGEVCYAITSYSANKKAILQECYCPTTTN